MKPLLRKLLLSLAALMGLGAASLGGYVYLQVSAFNQSVAKVYKIAVPQVHASDDASTVERGAHLAHSVAGCAIAECHGPDLSGGKITSVGPLGTTGAPNITSAGMGAVYSDGELMRLVEHGLKRDGTTVLFMVSHEINWLPQDDILAVIAYVRSVNPVSKTGGATQVGVLGKILDRRGKFAWDVARRINHDHLDKAPPPSPTAEYGRHIAKGCMGCHGETFGGGPIPGAPPDMPVPANITPDKTGLAGWSFEEFERLADHGIRKNGKPVDPFMPIEMLAHMDQTERKALFSFLTSLPNKPFGRR